MNSQSHRYLYIIKVRVLIGKESGPENWKGDVCKETDEDWDTKSLNSDESSSPAEAASPPPSEINPSLPEETAMPSLMQLPYRTMLILPRMHPHHTSLILDL